MSLSTHKQPVFKARELSAVRRESVRPSVEEPETSHENLPRVGDIIKERYLIEEMIGQGQFGWVFLVRHIWLGQRFAMKVMHPRVAHDPKWVERFREEARQTSALGHDNIVFVTDFDRCHALGYFFVMEYIEGVTLSSIIKHRRTLMEPLRALNIIFQACDALAAVHDVGVVHRDLKPSNIMVCTRDGEEFVKLLDFGISSNVFEVSSSRKLYGTPAYMAPEQTRTMNVCGRADQFALCTILYHMLVGERPWKIRKWADASLDVRQHRPLASVSQRREHALLTPELDAVIARALALRPEDRWENMREFAYALYVAAGLGDTDGVVCPFPGMSEPHDYNESGSLGEQPSMVTLAEQDSCAWGESPDVEQSATTSGRALSSITFRTNERLMREWDAARLSMGELELRTPRLCAPGEHISVRIVLEEEQLVVVLGAKVIAMCEGDASGISREGGVTRRVKHHVVARLDQPSFDRMSSLVEMLRDSSAMTQESLVRIIRPMSFDDQLSTGEAFLISRLSEPMRLHELKRLFSGLSFELDELLLMLVQKGFVHVESAADARAPLHSIGAHDSDMFSSSAVEESQPMHDTQGRFELTTGESRHTAGGYYMHTKEQVSHVLELVAFFKRTNNDSAAIETLRRAIDVSPTQGEFYHQLALLYARDDGAKRRAMRAIDTALEISPGHPEFQRSREYIRTLYVQHKKRVSS